MGAKVKTKLDKHALDNQKRRQALKDKAALKSSQSEIIKEALSTSKLHNTSNKKIFFNDDEATETERIVNGVEKPPLFDGSGSEDENFEINEKVQFSGKKGYELLQLQSTYGNDERFKIDERFVDRDDNLEDKKEQAFLLNEKSTEIAILEDILGQKAGKQKKEKKRTYEMIRYDASNKEHERQEVSHGKSEATALEFNKKRKIIKTEKPVKEQKPKTVVTQEKYFEVSKDIKNSFKQKADNDCFSILQAYGQRNDCDSDENENSQNNDGESTHEVVEEFEDEYIASNITRSPSGESKQREIDNEKTENSVAIAKGIWKESFFFSPDDPRFKEGLAFINKRNSQEAEKATKNYDELRRKLREILRLNLKRQLQRVNPFRNKLGGMNKKQLANNRSKNVRTGFHGKQRPKVAYNSGFIMILSSLRVPICVSLALALAIFGKGNNKLLRQC